MELIRPGRSAADGPAKKIDRSAEALRVSHHPHLSLQKNSTAQDWLATVQVETWRMAEDDLRHSLHACAGRAPDKATQKLEDPMCGIVGYIGPRNATPIILNGLKRLEYRGYDSAGIAVLSDGSLEVRKDAGKLSQLIELLDRSPLEGAPGIGHTRWATHGAPSARNAHPHLGQTKRVVVVQNGIVENFVELKDELMAEGVEFQSDTDTEAIVHLVERYLATGLDFVAAARQTFNQLHGANVVVLLSADEPDKIVTARIGNAGGVVVGLGVGENFLASDTPAIMEHTREVIFLESRQMAIVTCDSVAIETLDS